MTEKLKYEDVKQYLLAFSTGEPPGGFTGLLQLVLTGIDNLRKNVTEGDILEHAHFITDEQAGFLKKLLESRAESTAWFEDYIGHSSQTGLL